MKITTKATPWQLAQALARAATGQADVRQELETILASISTQADLHQPLAVQLSLNAMLLCCTVRAAEQILGRPGHAHN